jgi:hypothetical protein
MLTQSDFQTTAAPAHEVFDLAYYENYMFSTLLTGSKVWIAYPPFHNKPAALQKRYEELYGTKSGPIFLNISDKLQHGIVIVQKPGQTFMLLLFWSSIVFCTETSPSSEKILATALKLVERLLSIGMFLSVVRMRPSKAKEQTELIKYVDPIATHRYDPRRLLKYFKADRVV